MAILSDYHVHSNFSADSEEAMENQILKAIDLGFKNIAFTEHHDIDYKGRTTAEDNIYNLNTDSYLYELLKMKAKYENKINVVFGVEIGIQPHLRRELALFSKSHEFDFIIGSVHMLNGKDPYYRDLFNDISDEELYTNYFKEMYEDLKIFSNFDVLGHLDYIVRYGYNKDDDFSYLKYKEYIDPILEKIIDMEKGLEINTNGFHCGMKYPNPNIDILKRYHELGGEIITVGSDAHTSDRIGENFDKAAEILTECGFSYYCTFDKRVAEFHKI